MRTKRLITFTALFLAIGLMLVATHAQQSDGTGPARPSAPAARATHGGAARETVSVAANEPIPNIPGKRLVSHVVEYAPGGASVPHRHAPSAFVFAYVLSGAVRSQVDDGPARVYRAGETWFESPGAHHRVSANASDTEPARLLAVVIVDAADKQVTIPDAR